jgi:hypothetical protein
MGKLMLDIEHGSNGGYVVTWYKRIPNQIEKLGGSKTEKEQLAFADSKSLVEWINKVA